MLRFVFKKDTPRWFIFLADIGICLVSIATAFLLRFNFDLPEKEIKRFVIVVPFVLAVRAVSFIINRTYAGVIRYTSTKDAERIFKTIASGTLFFALSNIVSYYFVNGLYIIPFSVIGIDFLTTIFLMLASRITIKTLYHELNRSNIKATNVVIYGSGDLAIITKRTLDRDPNSNYIVVAFIDDFQKKTRKKLDNLTIYRAEEIELVLEKYSVGLFIFAKRVPNSQVKSRIISSCLNYDISVQTIPDVDKWINGELSVKQIKQIRIEDLLQRAPIVLDEKRIKQQVLNKVVLVTGAAGSIGSEIVRQICRFRPQTLILIDQAESPLYDLELELSEEVKLQNYHIVIADVTNRQRMEQIFRKFQPAIIYHAAAYKHVPMMESHPEEAVANNVHGTKILADLAVKYKASKFVMVSTDKAVNPTNVMGASKRIAEIYVQQKNRLSAETAFITTRFGNVLGSNGSVIPRFKSQIDKGGPVTVTHPEVTRYFMTIPEACQLVLEAGAMGNGGEIFIFDMGESVKIVNLARKMIRLSGFTVGRDIQLKFTGLRPGEKLYEELLNNEENTLPTHHPKIMVAKVRDYDTALILPEIKALVELSKSTNRFAIVKKMKDIVPEFLSKNSIYETLDNIDEN